MHSISVSLAKWYLSLMPVEPPRYYTERQPLERALMEYNDEMNGDSFLRHFDLDLRGMDILDLGCGFGGRTVRYKELGARSVMGSEIAWEPVADAQTFSLKKNAPIDVLEAYGENLPFRANSFDAVFSYDVFEHVNDLQATLNECYRVLRRGGTVYAIFPPIHHPFGGSHFHGYLSRSPMPELLFPRTVLLEAAERIMEERGQTVRPRIRTGEYLPSVNGTTVSDFELLVAAIPFASARITLRPLGSRTARLLNPVVALACRVPLLREITTSRIVCELTK